MDSNSNQPKVTKTSQVKKHLFSKGAIDSWTAINDYGATRLSAIIYNLRKRGLTIDSVPITVLDRNNNLCNLVNYVLIQNETKTE